MKPRNGKMNSNIPYRFVRVPPHPASSTRRLPAATRAPKPFTVPQLAPALVISRVTPAGSSVRQYSATLIPRVALAAFTACPDAAMRMACVWV